MSIEDYAIDDSAFTELINAVKASNDGNILFHTDDAGSIWVIPTTEKPIKVVFDTHEDGDCVEYGRENIWGVFEWDIDVATDEEIKDLLEVK